MAVVPPEIEDRLGESTALSVVELLHPKVEFVNDLAVGSRLTGRVTPLVTPLAPSATVGDASLLLKRDSTGKPKDLGLDFIRSHTGSLPEVRGLTGEDVDIHHPVELGHGDPVFIRVGTTTGWILSPGKEPRKLPLIHLIEEHQPRGVLPVIQLGKPGVPEIVRRRRLVPKKGLEEAHGVFWIVTPPIGAFGIGCFRRELVVVSLQRWQ